MSALNILKLGFVCRERESHIYHIDLRPAAPRWCKWAVKHILWGKHAREHPQLSIHNSFSLYHPTALWLIMIPWAYLKSSQLASLYDSTHVSQQLITAERGGIARTHIRTRQCSHTHMASARACKLSKKLQAHALRCIYGWQSLARSQEAAVLLHASWECGSSGASAKSQPWNQLLLASVSQPSLYPSMAANTLYSISFCLTHTRSNTPPKQPFLSGNGKSLSACIVLFILSFLSGADLFIILHTSVCSSAHGASCLSCNCSSIISGDESQGLMGPLSPCTVAPDSTF